GRIDGLGSCFTCRVRCLLSLLAKAGNLLLALLRKLVDFLLAAFNGPGHTAATFVEDNARLLLSLIGIRLGSNAVFLQPLFACAAERRATGWQFGPRLFTRLGGEDKGGCCSD